MGFDHFRHSGNRTFISELPYVISSTQLDGMAQWLLVVTHSQLKSRRVQMCAEIPRSVKMVVLIEDGPL